MSKEAMKLALEALAVKFSEGWHEGIKIDASDIMLLNDAAQALAEQPAQQEPVAKVDANDEGYWADILTDASTQFNAAIDFAIEEGSGAAVFLRCWREGDTSEWPEFEAAHNIKENT